ncbi:uncharacterized protein [Palaemon carinicauda]|uniref:uncharacterized protein isoform X2 n=2 Tax=Palaemon carinicauda TaxID=392227 RepID=UPI0035B60410
MAKVKKSGMAVRQTFHRVSLSNKFLNITKKSRTPVRQKSARHFIGMVFSVAVTKKQKDGVVYKITSSCYYFIWRSHWWEFKKLGIQDKKSEVFLQTRNFGFSTNDHCHISGGAILEFLR